MQENHKTNKQKNYKAVSTFVIAKMNCYCLSICTNSERLCQRIEVVFFFFVFSPNWRSYKTACGHLPIDTAVLCIIVVFSPSKVRALYATCHPKMTFFSLKV